MSNQYNPFETVPGTNISFNQVEDAARVLMQASHGLAMHCGWWKDPVTGADVERNVGELLMLTVSEVAEAMEGHRKNLMDDKLPHFRMFGVELADTVIRIGDMTGRYAPEFPRALAEKLFFNSIRADHTLAARAGENGKKY